MHCQLSVAFGRIPFLRRDSATLRLLPAASHHLEIFGLHTLRPSNWRWNNDTPSMNWQLRMLL
ncbi:hypothetical protein C8R44DRAFT_796249 [Mycena epipterygia]|nr:hypothetical protein C8R44DRAFT_796249 [Mycena epipterygia]